jgi:hypothetical protein
MHIAPRLSLVLALALAASGATLTAGNVAVELHASADDTTPPPPPPS